MIKHKKIAIGIAIFVCTILGIYFGLAIYFTGHYYFGSQINSIDVSGKTIEEAQAILMSRLQNYTLTLKERGGKTEQFKGEEIGLKYRSEDAFRNFKDSQKPLKWVAALFNKENSKMTVEVQYDEQLLKERIDQLSCFDSKQIIEPKNPEIKYINNQYVIIEEVSGTKVDKELLFSAVADSILQQESELDLELADCYIKSQYNSTSPKIIEAKDTLNQYISSKITYNFGDRQEILDDSMIHQWLSIDENYQITFYEEKVKEYVKELSKTYNTIGRTREFITSSGEKITVGGGDYGWYINQDEEAQYLIQAIKEGTIETREPAYIQTAFSRNSNDIGNTYVEIDLTNQYLWFYKNGTLITEGPVVTGNVSTNHTTPKGVYRLKYKQRNAILRGPGYAAPVSFWMPFNGDIGIHDATWRSRFGGNIYKTNGSHGCINCPYNVARDIFNDIEVGTPVICY
ncbi:MAG: L,D-transpeptidase family protein [Epulopiscium sp.]|nr:L,D-transpeptidase family protein [Candidatus Epulonipiscium sp.]